MKFPKRRCWRILLILLLCETALDASCVYAGALKAEDIEIGNTVTFGKYEQDRSKSGKEELEWRVLEKDTDKKMALLITGNCIECMPYHTEKTDITWKDSSLRQWLNSMFLQETFSDEEQDQVLEADIETYVNQDLNSDGVVRTSDRIFLLSDEEVKKYFKDKTDRLAKVSPLIHKEVETEENEAEGETNDEKKEEEGGMKPAVSELTDGIFWWLRSPGDRQDCAECVGAEGSVVTAGYTVLQANFGVRPAMWVKLD